MNGDLDQPAEDEGMFEPHKRLKLDGDRAVWREVGEEVVVLDVETATYLSLNGSGGALWKRLDAGATPDELVASWSPATGSLRLGPQRMLRTSFMRYGTARCS